MQTVHTPNAPEPSGHYSQAIIHNGTVYVAGQLAIDPDDLTRRPTDISGETRQALQNVRAILEAAGSGLDRIVQMTVFLSDMAHWAAVNAVLADTLGNHRPARAIVPCGTLNRGYQVEIVAVGAVA